MKLTKQQEQQMEAQHLKRCILEDGFEILEIAGENPHDYPTYDSLQQATNSIYRGYSILQRCAMVVVMPKRCQSWKGCTTR